MVLVRREEILRLVSGMFQVQILTGLARSSIGRAPVYFSRLDLSTARLDSSVVERSA